MKFGPLGVEFQVELAGAKKCVHQKSPKVRASNGRTDLFYVAMLRHVSCFPSCQVGFFNVEYQLFGD